MRGINKAILLGNVGKLPEVSSDADGKPVAKFSLVTARSVGGVEERVWHRVECRGRLAEIVGQYAEKGSALYLEGRLEPRTTQAAEGQSAEVLVAADTIQLLSRDGEWKRTPEVYVDEPHVFTATPSPEES